MRILSYCVLSLLSLICSISATQGEVEGTPSPQQREEFLNNTLNYAKGHDYFRNVVFQQHEMEFARLVKDGQSPQTLFIGCSDSRIIPDLMLSTKPGDLFVIRTAGNFVPSYSPTADDGVSATIQYAVEVLNVRDIIVCGHSQCGAIEGLYKKLNPGQLSILQRWIRWGEEAKRITMASARQGLSQKELYRITEQVSVILQLDHLMSYPAVKKLVEENKVNLHGWYYCIETGEITYYDPKLYLFFPLTTSL